MEQITILINTLDKMQKTLNPSHQSGEILHSKIINACKGIEACKMACYRPSTNLPSLIRDLRSGIEIQGEPLKSTAKKGFELKQSVNKEDTFLLTGNSLVSPNTKEINITPALIENVGSVIRKAAGLASSHKER